MTAAAGRSTPTRPTSRHLPRLTGLVVLGGMLGTALRAQLEGAFAAPAGGWPWTTFVINVVGSLVLGALLEVLSRTGRDAGWRRAVRVGLGTGVLGGFTTYSSFIVETALLVRDGHAGTGVVYAVVSLVVGLLSATAGFVVGAAVTPATTATRADGDR